MAEIEQSRPMFLANDAVVELEVPMNDMALVGLRMMITTAEADGSRWNQYAALRHAAEGVCVRRVYMRTCVRACVCLGRRAGMADRIRSERLLYRSGCLCNVHCPAKLMGDSYLASARNQLQESVAINVLSGDAHFIS